MAIDLEKLVVQLEANVRGYERQLAKASRDTDRTARRIERRFDNLNKKINQSFSLRGLQTALAGIGFTAGARELQQYADLWTSFGNRLRAVGEPATEVGNRLNELTDVAVRSRTSLEGVVSLYAKVNLATKELGVTSREVVGIVETVSKAITLSGASAAEAQSTIIQLSQALGSGLLQGDELRALRENSPLLAQAIAREFDTTVAGLKKLGEEGALTSERVLRAIQSATAGINTAFDKTTPTIAQAATVLNTAFTQFIGTSGAVGSAAQVIADSLIFLSKNLETTAGVLATAAAGFIAFKNAAAISAVFGGVVAGAGAAKKALTALTAIVVAFNAAARTSGGGSLVLGAALATLNRRATAAGASFLAMSRAFLVSPLGIAVTAATAAGAAIYYFSQSAEDGAKKLKSFSDASDKVAEASKRLGQVEVIAATQDVERARRIWGDYNGTLDEALDRRRKLIQQDQKNSLREEIQALTSATAKWQEFTRLQERVAAARATLDNIAPDGRDVAPALKAQADQIRNSVDQAFANLGLPRTVFTEVQTLTQQLGKAERELDFNKALDVVNQIISVLNGADISEGVRNGFIEPLQQIREDIKQVGKSRFELTVDVRKQEITEAVQDALEGVRKFKLSDFLEGNLTLEIDSAEYVAALGDAQLAIDNLEGRVKAFRNNAQRLFSEAAQAQLAASQDAGLPPLSQEVFNSYKAVVDAFIDGNISAEKLNTEVTRLLAQNPASSALAQGLRTSLIAPAAAAGRTLEEVSKKRDQLFKTGTTGDSALADVLDDAAKKATKLGDLLDGLSQSELDNVTLTTISDLSSALDEAARRSTQLEDKLQSAFDGSGLGDDVQTKLQDVTQQFLSGQITALQYDATLSSIGQGLDADAIISKIRTISTELTNNAALQERLASAQTAISSGTVTQARSGGNVKSTQDRITALRAERDELRNINAAISGLNPTARDFEQRLEAVRIEQELLTKATRDGVTVSAEQRAEITKLAQETAALNAQQQRLTSNEYASKAEATRREADEITRLVAAYSKLDPAAAGYKVQLEAARIEQELYNAALEASGTVTEEQIAKNRELALQLAVARDAASRSGRTDYADAVEGLQKEADQIDRLVAAYSKLSPTSADYKIKLEAARIEQELYNAALEAGGTVTEEQIKKNRELALQLATAREAVSNSGRTDYVDAVENLRKENEQIERQIAALSGLDPVAGNYALQLEAMRIEQELLNAAREQGITLDASELASISARAEQAALLRKNYEDLTKAQQEVQDRAKAASDAQKEFVSSFTKDILAGKNAMESLASAVDKLADKLVNLAIDQTLNSLFSGSTAASNPLGSFIGNIFGGFRAAGGPVSSGKAYVVGEKGPELLVGAQGRIIPNSALGASKVGGGVVVNVNNMNGSQVDTEQQRNADGSTSIRLIVRDAVRSVLPSELNNVMPKQFGVSPTLARR